MVRMTSSAHLTQIMTGEEGLELAIEPLDVFFAVSWASSPMTPDGRKDFQLSSARPHVCNFILRILGTVRLLSASSKILRQDVFIFTGSRGPSLKGGLRSEP